MKWYCIQTKPQKEAFASHYCRSILGLETFVPLLELRKRSRGQRKTILRPLFPHYIFCRFELGSHYRAVKYAPDVNDIVHAAGSPAIVSDELVNDLRSWAENPLDARTLEPTLHHGELVVITDGMLNGMQAVFLQNLSDCERVEVLLLVLNCGARMILDKNEVKRAS